MKISKGHGNKLEQNMERAILALLSTSSIREAAKKLGIPHDRLLKWKRDDAFVAEYAKARKELLDEGVAQLQGLVGDAVKALRRNMQAKAPPGQQVQSARAVLENVIKRHLEVAGPGGGPIPVGAYVLNPDDLEKLDDAQLEALRPVLVVLDQRGAPRGADRLHPRPKEG